MKVSDAVTLYVGSFDVEALYVGEEQVWSAGGAFLWNRVSVQIDTGSVMFYPSGLALPKAPVISSMTRVISETPVGVTPGVLNVPPVPVVSVTTTVE